MCYLFCLNLKASLSIAFIPKQHVGQLRLKILGNESTIPEVVNKLHHRLHEAQSRQLAREFCCDGLMFS